MSEKEQLTFQERNVLAQRYQGLNSLLTEKKRLNDRISDLCQEINSLRQQANEVDIKFNKLVIEVEPTEVIDLKKHNGKEKKRLLDIILEKVAQGNVSPEALGALLDLYKKK